MRLYSAKETAELLNISYYTLLAMRKRGEGPKATLVGCLIKYHPKHIKEYLDEQSAEKE